MDMSWPVKAGWAVRKPPNMPEFGNDHGIRRAASRERSVYERHQQEVGITSKN